MARKRYETAFIPASTSPAPYTDVDSLLLSIESFSLGAVKESGSRPSERLSDGQYHRRRSKSANNDRASNQSGPSISILYQRSSHFGSSREETSSPATTTDTEQGRIPSERSASHVINVQRESITPGVSRSESPVRKMPVSLSEPLRPKHCYMKSYSSIQSSSGCSTTNSSSPVPNESILKSRRTSKTTMPKRNVLTLMKVNSASSLDSIDSERSDDLNYASKGPPPNSKLLSPISDKSPIEPPIVNTATFNLKEMIGGGSELSEKPLAWKKQNLLAAAEQLSHLPWEMPKLKRKIALLVDSGISLDYHGSNDFNPIKAKAEFQKNSQGSPATASTDQVISEKTNNFDSSTQHSCNQIKTDTELSLQEKVMDEICSAERLQKELEENREKPIQDEGGPPPSHPLSLRPDRCKMKLDFGDRKPAGAQLINTKIKLESQDWFHGAITRIEAEEILRASKEGSFLVRNCESCVFNRYSVSVKTSRGFIHVRIEPYASSGTFSLGEEELRFSSVPSLILHFMSHRLPIKGAEHVLLKYPVITNLL